MKKYLYIIFLTAAASLLWSCNDSSDGTAGSLKDVSAEPNIGSVVLKWANPDVPNYYYTVVTYVNSAGETVKKKISSYSVDSEKGAGYTAATIFGFTDTNTYEFTLTPYTADGWPGEKTTVSCAPEDASMAYKYIAASAVVSPLVEGAKVKWTNEWGVGVIVNVSYTDLEGKVQTKRINSATTDSTECLAFVNPTKITVTSENTKGEVSTPTEVEATPLNGEIPWSRMKVSASSSWQPSSSATPTIPENLITGALKDNWGWVSNPVAGTDPYYLTFDLSAVHIVNLVEMVRTWLPAFIVVSPSAFDIQVSLDGKDFTKVGTFAFGDNNLTYNHSYSFTPVKARYVKIAIPANLYGFVAIGKVCIYYGETATHFAEEAAAELQPDADDDETVYPDMQYLYPYTAEPGWLNHLTVEQNNPDNATQWKYTTTGGDSWCFLTALSEDAQGPVLVFRYKCSQAIRCEFFWMDNQASPAGGRETAFDIPAKSEWTTFKHNFSADWAAHNWKGKKGMSVRFDVGDGAGVTLEVRNMHWRAATSSD